MTLDTIAPAVERDRWGRPKIKLPDGAGWKNYTRATTIAKAMDDTSNLQQWGERMVIGRAHV